MYFYGNSQHTDPALYFFLILTRNFGIGFELAICIKLLNMPKANKIEPEISLEGTIIEIFERDGKSFAKINSEINNIVVNISQFPELHLEDKIVLRCSLITIKPILN